jgi:hypothetical protein
MESIQTIWNPFLFFSMLVLPRLLGVLAYFRIRRFQDLLAHLVGFLIPPALYFYFSWLIFVYLPHKDHAEDGGGMAAVAAGFIVLLGTGAQIIVGLIAQLMLRGRHRVSLASK